MPCNCGKKSSTQVFVFTHPNGQKYEYTSEVQAKAAQIRAGGGTVTPR
jgi:hypothetical protein